MILLVLPCNARAEEKVGRLTKTICQDYYNFYSWRTQKKLIIGLGVAGAAANTPADEKIQDYYQESLRRDSTDNLSKQVKPFGDGMLTVPIYLGAAILGKLTDRTGPGSIIGGWVGTIFKSAFGGRSPNALFANSSGSFKT